MRITIILPADSLAGGIRVLALYAQRLAAKGHLVNVVQPRHRSPSLPQIIRSLRAEHRWPENPNQRYSHFDSLGQQNLRRIVLSHAGPVTEADVPDADLVLASWWETAEWVWALPPSKGVKAHFMQDYEIWGGNIERVDATCRLPMPKIVIANWVADLLSSRFGQVAAAIIPNSVDTKVFAAPPRGKRPVPTVGFTYSPMRSKGADIAIAAINLARAKLPALNAMCFGAARATRDLPVPASCTFHYSLPDSELPGVYGSCDSWLFATRKEGFGLPILEAMACRTPVIGSPAGAAPELIARGGGILVPMEDPEAMATAIVSVAGMSEQEWRALSDAAHANANTYTWDRATERFEAALLEIRSKHG